MGTYISFDIGGTAIKYGILDECGSILEKDQIHTEAYLGGAALVRKVKFVISEKMREQMLDGVCISTAGMVDCESGKIIYSGELIPGYTGYTFKREIEEGFSVPCEIENDVNCAGLAEYMSGAARGAHSAVCLTVGTGIGGCIILDGKVFHGYGNSAGELGYMHMNGSDFQSLGAASILCRKVAERKGEPESQWDGKRIFEAAADNDEICLQSIDEMVDILGQGIANICYLLNPQVVVLGGGIMAQKDVLGPKISASLEGYLKETVRKHTKLAFAEHGNDAGLLGAFYHFKQRRGVADSE